MKPLPSEQTGIREGLPPLPHDAPKPSEPTPREVILAWERRRIVYNVIMLFGLCLLLERLNRAAEMWIPGSVLCGFGLCYFVIINAAISLCHAIEVYLCWHGMRRHVVRRLVFIGLMVLSNIMVVGLAIRLTFRND